MNALLELIVGTFLHPRQIATGLIAERFDRASLFAGGILVIVLVGIVQYAVQQFTPAPVATPETEALLEVINNLFATPFITTFVVGSGFVMSVVAVCLGGRMIGGTGTMLDTLLVMSWIQFVNAVTGSVVVLILAASPQLYGVASLLNLMINIGIFYATLHFIDVLHGYNSMWTAFGTMVISFIGLAIGLALIITLIGGTAAQTGAI